MTKKEANFVQTVYAFYRHFGRLALPWRATRVPYKIVVSEIMLQQTQVERVVPKYHEFLKKFPTVQVLASAQLGDVLRVWQGLGFNRRAKMLWLLAKEVSTQHQGRFPRTYEGLEALPGIGAYTAGAVMAFAYNQAVPIIETNIRTVYLYHFFPKRTDVKDTEVTAIIARTLDVHDPKTWYSALMDYGAHLKKTSGNHNLRSRAYQKQPRFVGSTRALRGSILRCLARQEKASRAALVRTHSRYTEKEVEAQLVALIGEGLIQKTRTAYRLP